MLTDYHVHMAETGGFSLNYLKQYIKNAKNEGIQVIGRSEHAYFLYETQDILPNDWVDNRRHLYFEEYQPFVDRANEKDLPVKMGIEMDYTPGKEEEMEEFIDNHPFDYVIGKVNWIANGGIDLDIHKRKYDEYNIQEVYDRYSNKIVNLSESQLFDCVVIE